VSPLSLWSRLRDLRPKRPAFSKYRKLGNFQNTRLGCENLEPRWLLASTLPAGFQETLITGGLNQPTAMTVAPDGRIFVTEKPYDIRVVKNGALLPTPFVNLSVHSTEDQGIQSVVFDPNFVTNGFVYVFYTHSADATGPFNRLSRFHVSTSNPDVADPASETPLLDHIYTLPSGILNGGAMRFGADGMLYVALGSLTEPNKVQDLSTLNGKLLRLNVANFPGSMIPSDNPYVGTPGARPEIWAYGFRSPFSGDMKPGTNTFFVNDVGSGLWEEINSIVVGANYGWPIAEGNSTNPALSNPLYSYAHIPPNSGAAITGGSFYTHSAFPGYADSYFFADYVNGFIKNLNPANGTVADFATNVEIPVGVVQGPDGSLYWISLYGNDGDGAIYRISYVGSGNRPPDAVATATTPTSGAEPLMVSFSGAGSSDPDGDPLTYTWSFGDGGTATGATVSHLYNAVGVYNVTLTVSDPGLADVSDPIVVTVGNHAPTGTITLPGAQTYRSGDTILFSGAATDPEDGTLPAAAFEWSIVFHHNTHTHPFLDSIPRGQNGQFPDPANRGDL